MFSVCIRSVISFPRSGEDEKALHKQFNRTHRSETAVISEMAVYVGNNQEPITNEALTQEKGRPV